MRQAACCRAASREHHAYASIMQIGVRTVIMEITTQVGRDHVTVTRTAETHPGRAFDSLQFSFLPMSTERVRSVFAALRSKRKGTKSHPVLLLFGLFCSHRSRFPFFSLTKSRRVPPRPLSTFIVYVDMAHATVEHACQSQTRQC